MIPEDEFVGRTTALTRHVVELERLRGDHEAYLEVCVKIERMVRQKHKIGIVAPEAIGSLRAVHDLLGATETEMLGELQRLATTLTAVKRDV